MNSKVFNRIWAIVVVVALIAFVVLPLVRQQRESKPEQVINVKAKDLIEPLTERIPPPTLADHERFLESRDQEK